MKHCLTGQLGSWVFAQLVLSAFICADALVLKAEPRTLLELKAETVSEAMMRNGPLFPVSVAYEWKKHDPAEGVTVVMDKDSGSLKMVSGVSSASDAIAWGYMKDELSKNGWVKLFIQTTDSTSVSNDVRMYAAGFLEGMLTAVRMSQFYSNFYQVLIKDQHDADSMEVIKKVFHDELEYVKKSANFHPGVISTEPADPYWKHMRYQFLQMWAVKDGYNFVALAKGVRQIDMIDMMIINSHAELAELLQAYTPEAMKKRKTFQTQARSNLLQKANGSQNTSALPEASANIALTANVSDKVVDQDWEERLMHRGHCSGLIRIAPENKDLMVGHTTWSDYSKMTRIFKYYHFHLPGAYTKANVIGFSSYPGCISSTDDFYEMDSGLVVMDTSLEILNLDVYNRVAEFPANAHVPNFMHIMTANRMASTGSQWAVLFSERNSGTNNAQWMIVDYNRFAPGKPILDGTLWVLEQVPGMMFKKDMSFWLRDKGYWASYNRPYFTEIRKTSGHTQAESLHGALYSYENGPRASIFKNVAPLVGHLMDLRSVMNRNTWPSEGVLPNSPGHAISARMDLSFSKIPNGGIDAKVVNRCLFRSMQCQAISGPSHDNQQVFKWAQSGSDVLKGWPHMGMPDVWDFNWVQMTPTAQLKSLVDVEQCSA